MHTNFAPEDLPLRNSPIPLHHQVYSLIRSKLENGVFHPGEVLPPEIELEKILRVSRATVRRALNDLASDGFLRRSTGKGTFILRTKIEDTRNHSLGSLAEVLRKGGHKVDFQILQIKHVEPSQSIKTKLELAADAEPVQLIERLIIADSEPMAIAQLYLAVDSSVNFTSDQLQTVDSVFPLLEAHHGIVVGFADKTIEATAATHYEASLLRVNVGSPILLVELVVYSTEHQPIAFGKTLYHGNKYKYRLHLQP